MGKVIDPKALMLAVKRKQTLKQVAEDFQMGYPEEITNAIKRVSHSNSEYIISELLKNQKSAEKALEKRSKKKQIVEVCVPTEEPDYCEVEEDEQQLVEEEQRKQKRDELLKSLTEDEQEFSSMAVKLETEHKQMQQERVAIVSEVKRKKEEIIALQQQIKQLEETIVSSYEQYSKLEKAMEAKSTEIADIKDMLSEIRDEIQGLNAVNIMVNDNTFETENLDLDVETVDETDWFNRIISMPEAEELTVKQIRNLAKVSTIVHELKQRGQEYNIVFENGGVEELFNKMGG